MADVITRFKLETTQFDSKLRDSAQSLSQLTRHLQLAGKDFDRFAQQHVEAARSFGQVESGATNLKDKLKDLVGAYNQVAKAYNSLTQEQQQTDYGKAMSASLQKLQGDIKSTKEEMNAVPGVLDKLKERFVVNVDAMKLFNIGLKAAEGALNVMKDAFFQSESNVDEWGRTVRSAEGIYQSFLQSLNSSDFSGFLSGISQVTQAARDAYNAIDELQTRQTILNPERAKLQARATELKATIRREGKDSAAGQKAQQDLKALEKPLTEAWKTEARLNYNAFEKLVKERLAQGNINLDAKSFNEFMKTFSSDKAYQSLRSHAKGSVEIKQGTYIGGTMTGQNMYVGGGKVDTRNTEKKLLDLFTDEWRKANSGFLSAAYNARGSAASVMLNDARYVREGGGSGGSGGSSGGGGGGGNTKADVEAVSGSIDEQTKLVQELQKAWRAAADDDSRQKIKAELEEQQYLLDRMTGKEKFDPTKMLQMSGVSVAPKIEMPELKLPDISNLKNEIQLELTAQNVKIDEAMLKTLLQDAFQNGIDMMDVQFAMINEKIANGVDVPDSAWQSILDQYNEIRTKIGQEPIQIDFNTGSIVKTGKETEKSWQAAASAVQSVGSALQQVEDPGAKIAGIVGQAIANIALGFAQASSSPATTAAGVWGWIAAIAGGIGTMVSTISAIHSATGYAEGGIIKGNTYSGDLIPANGGTIGLNAGEVVLNRAQAGVLASQLEGTSRGGGEMVRTVLSGEQCYLMIDRYARRSGKGELMFWRS